MCVCVCVCACVCVCVFVYTRALTVVLMMDRRPAVNGVTPVRF